MAEEGGQGHGGQGPVLQAQEAGKGNGDDALDEIAGEGEGGGPLPPRRRTLVAPGLPDPPGGDRAGATGGR